MDFPKSFETLSCDVPVLHHLSVSISIFIIGEAETIDINKSLSKSNRMSDVLVP